MLNQKKKFRWIICTMSILSRWKFCWTSIR